MIPPKVLLVVMSLGAVAPLWASFHGKATRSPVPTLDAEAVSAEADGKLAASVAKLKELGVIGDPDYWLQNAVRGKSCDGAMVGDLIISAAKKFSPADNVQDAVNILVDNKILENKDSVEYWQTKAVAGKKCPGRFVSIMINQLADTL